MPLICKLPPMLQLKAIQFHLVRPENILISLHCNWSCTLASLGLWGVLDYFVCLLFKSTISSYAVVIMNSAAVTIRRRWTHRIRLSAWAPSGFTHQKAQTNNNQCNISDSFPLKQLCQTLLLFLHADHAILLSTPAKYVKIGSTFMQLSFPCLNRRLEKV